jgi:hypothetical protein
MPHLIRSALLVVLVALPASAQRSTRAVTPADIVRGVTALRADFLQDSTPIDFCELPELFGADGTLPRDPRLPPALYTSLRDCANAAPESRPPLRVELLRRSMVGDTVVIHAVTHRGWVRFLEEYRFARPYVPVIGPTDASLLFPEYRIVAHIQR